MARARINWPALAKPSSIVGPTVGVDLLPAMALDVAAAAQDAGAVPDVVVQIADPELWERAWGELR